MNGKGWLVRNRAKLFVLAVAAVLVILLNPFLLTHHAIVAYKQATGTFNISWSAQIDSRVKIPASSVVGRNVVIEANLGRVPKIGENVMVNNNVIIWGDVEIGDGTRINPYVIIQDCDHGFDDDKIGDNGFPVPVYVPVRIGRDVMITTGAIVNKGVSIGDCATVMSGAIVFDDVPAGAVVQGNPAVIVGWNERCEKAVKR